MLFAQQALDSVVQPSGWSNIFIVPADVISGSIEDFDSGQTTLTINGIPVTAVAEHPDFADLLYATTDAPESLDFLPDPYIQISP